MWNLLVSFLVMTVAVYVTSKIVPGFKVKDFGTAAAVAVVYGLLNAFLYKTLFILMFPVAVLSLGLIVNMVLLWLTDKIVSEVEIKGFFSLFFSALAISVLRFVLYLLLERPA